MDAMDHVHQIPLGSAKAFIIEGPVPNRLQSVPISTDVSIHLRFLIIWEVWYMVER